MSKIVLNPNDNHLGQSVSDYASNDINNNIRKNAPEIYQNQSKIDKESAIMNNSISEGDSNIGGNQNFVKEVPSYIDTIGTYDNQINQLTNEINKGNAFENLIFWVGILFFIISAFILLYFILKYFNISIF